MKPSTSSSMPELSTKTKHHMKAPRSASFVASLRNVFGNENVKVLYVKEGEVELGEPQPVGAPCVHGALGYPLQEIYKEQKKAA
jgi:hypothetical protein